MVDPGLNVAMVDGLDIVPVGIAEEGAVVVVPVLGRSPGNPPSREPASVPARQNSSTWPRDGAVNAMCSRRVTGWSSLAAESEKSSHSAPTCSSL